MASRLGAGSNKETLWHLHFHVGFRGTVHNSEKSPDLLSPSQKKKEQKKDKKKKGKKKDKGNELGIVLLKEITVKWPLDMVWRHQLHNLSISATLPAKLLRQVSDERDVDRMPNPNPLELDRKENQMANLYLCPAAKAQASVKSEKTFDPNIPTF